MFYPALAAPLAGAMVGHYWLGRTARVEGQ